MTESFNNLNIAIRRLEERLPPPGRTSVLVLQPPHACAHHVTHCDGGGYYGADAEDAVSDDHGSNQQRPWRYFFNRRGTGCVQCHGGGDGQEDNDLGKIKITMPVFTGRADPKVYLEWEMHVSQIFDNHNYSEQKKIRVASIEFTKYAIIWQDQLNHVGEHPHTWEEMK